MNDTIGLIGVGNMGTAILEGLFERRISKPSQVWIYDKMRDKARDFSNKWGVHCANSVEEVAVRALGQRPKADDPWVSGVPAPTHHARDEHQYKGRRKDGRPARACSSLPNGGSETPDSSPRPGETRMVKWRSWEPMPPR